VPAEHITTIDHEMELPNSTVNPQRKWQSTQFVHYKADQTQWTPWRLPGWVSHDTGIGNATEGVAGVHVSRPDPNAVESSQTRWASHDTDILFTFVKEGTLTLEVQGEQTCSLAAGDAFVLPPFVKARYIAPSTDCKLIETALHANFSTTFE